VINIVNRSEAAGLVKYPYVGDGPAIVVVHTVDRSTVVAMLRAWAKNQRADDVASLLHDAGVKVGSLPAEGPFMVSVDGHGAPKAEHPDIRRATNEAERLAKLSPGYKVRILQMVGWRKAEATVTMRGEP